MPELHPSGTMATSLPGGAKHLQMASECWSLHFKQQWGDSGMLPKSHHKHDDLIKLLLTQV